jgi:glycosyltransferase involved in cell wall biosynthesis
MKLSFIIPAYNEELYLDACLDSILRQAAGRYHEIIVVDNGSTDATSEIARKKPGVRVVYEDRRGITRARQRGLEQATGDLIAYVDADTRLPPSWIDIAERAFQSDRDLLCLSGPYRYYDGPFFKRLINDMISAIVLPTGNILFGYMLVGGNYVVQRDALFKAGGFDRNIDFFGEDTDIGRRLHALGPMSFRLDFFLFSSGRRFYGEGMLRANTIYLLNYLWVVLFHRPLSKTHSNVRTVYSVNRSRHVGLFSSIPSRICSHFFTAISRTLSRSRSLMPRRTTTITTADTTE